MRKKLSEIKADARTSLGNKEMDVIEAAGYLGINPKTLRNKIYAGVGPRHTKRFGRLRFAAADLDAYMSAAGHVREAYFR
jgi:hypothetical protein